MTDPRAAAQQAAVRDEKTHTPDAAEEKAQRNKGILGSIKNKLEDIRHGIVRATPAFVVNNSPNFIGGLQLSAELLMFKSNGTTLVSPENKGKPLHYIIDPPRNVLRSVTGRAGFQFKVSDLKNGDFYKNSLRNIVDVKAATEQDLRTGPLINRWQARATFAGIVGWGLNFITPNAKETDEEVAANAKLQAENPVRYVGECLRRAVVFPFMTIGQIAHKVTHRGELPDGQKEIGAYKRYFSGLGMLVAGTCSFLGGWRNVSRSGGRESYYFNWQYCATGFITAMSSLPLLFSVDNDRGYSKFGAIHLMRCFFLPGSIWKKYKSEDKGVGWYIGGHGLLQTKNAFAASVGGARKIVHSDGTVEIVDHSDEIQQGKQEALAKKEKKEKDAGQPQDAGDKADDAREQVVPRPTISGKAFAELAMPERAMAAAEFQPQGV